MLGFGDVRLQVRDASLLELCQTLKSTGDYEGTKQLFADYGITFDEALRDEVLARYADLDKENITVPEGRP